MELLVAGGALAGVVDFTGYRAWRRFSLASGLESGLIFDDLSMDEVSNELDHGRGDD